jgi:hypothetical protein
MSITRDSIEQYSHTTCIHCNDFYFELWDLTQNNNNKSEEILKKFFELILKLKCDKCNDADEMRSKLSEPDIVKPEINIEKLERNCPPGWEHLWK